MKLNTLLLALIAALQIAALQAEDKKITINFDGDIDFVDDFDDFEIIEADTDFVSIEPTSNVIIDTASKANPTIDWQFELTNKSGFTAFVLLSAPGNKTLLPESVPQGAQTLGESFYKLPNGASVRIAGAEKKAVLVVLDGIEAKNKAFTPTLRQSLKDDKREQIVNFDNKTLLEINRDFELVPAQPVAGTDSTASGIKIRQ